MEHRLVVVDPFDKYVKGDLIEDPDTVEAVLGSEDADKVRKINREE